MQTLWNQRKQLVLENGILYRKFKDVLGGSLHPKLQLVLPATLVQDVLTGLHDSPVGGHLGTKKTLEKVRCRFYWPGQRKDVERWCKNCFFVQFQEVDSQTLRPFTPNRGCTHAYATDCDGYYGSSAGN